MAWQFWAAAEKLWAAAEENGYLQCAENLQIIDEQLQQKVGEVLSALLIYFCSWCEEKISFPTTVVEINNWNRGESTTAVQQNPLFL